MDKLLLQNGFIKINKIFLQIISYPFKSMTLLITFRFLILILAINSAWKTIWYKSEIYNAEKRYTTFITKCLCKFFCFNVPLFEYSIYYLHALCGHWPGCRWQNMALPFRKTNRYHHLQFLAKNYVFYGENVSSPSSYRPIRIQKKK